MLRHAERLAAEPALIDGVSGRALTYGALAAGVERAGGRARRRAASGAATSSRSTSRTCPSTRSRCTGRCAPAAWSRARARCYTAHELAEQVRRARAALRRLRRPAGGDRPRRRRATPRCSSSASCWPAGRARRRRSVPTRGEVALLLPSSGTTGLPKLVELTHRALVANLVQMRVPFPVPEGSRQLGLAPFFHSMGLQCVLHRGLDQGAAVVTLARFELEQMLQAMQDHRVEQALVAPPLVAAFARHPIVDGYDLSALTPARQRRRAARSRARARRPSRGSDASSPRGSASPRRARSWPARTSRAGAPPRRHLRPARPRRRGAGRQRRAVGPRPAAVFTGYRDDPEATAATHRRRRLAAHRRPRPSSTPTAA